MNRQRQLRVLFAALILAGVAGTIYYIGQQNTATGRAAPEVPRVLSPGPAVEAPPQAATFDRARYSLTDPVSLWVVVNKKRPLQPASYVPAALVVPDVVMRSNITGSENLVRSDVTAALKNMFTAAANVGVQLNVQSAYRSYNYQTSLYNRYVSQQGQGVADTQSARPGHSEHQTGLAVDVGGTTRPACNVEACFADTTEGKWIEAHSHEYGFIIRYPKGLDSITGYTYEPWHLRYVGSELAGQMHADNTATMEQFFELPAAADYN